jgi:type I restriction enzyme S subunit
LDGNHGGLYPRNEEFTSSGVPYITANDFITGKVLFSKCKFLPEKKASKFKKGLAKNGDVLFAHNATVGPVAILETNLDYVILSTTATYFRCDNRNLLNSYLRYYFETKGFIEQYTKVMSQSTRNQVPITTQRKFFVSLPTLSEQTKIASFLNAVDKKLEAIKKKKTLLEQYKKGVMQKIFNQEIRFKDENGNKFSVWEKRKLGDVSDVRDGTHDSPKYHDNGYPFITSKNLMKDGSIDFVNISLIKREDFIKINKRSKVDINDILFGMIGTIGNPVLVKNDGFAIKNVALIKERMELLNIYLIHFLKSPSINQQFKEQNTGGTQKFLSLNTVRNLSIDLPCLSEQTKIADFLSAIDTKIDHTNTLIEKTKLWKKGLLQQLFV